MRTHKPDMVPAQTVQCPSPQQGIGDGETKGPVQPQPPPPVSPPGSVPAREGSGTRAVGEQMPPGASPRYLIEAGWGTPAPAEKRGSASSGAGPCPFSTQGRGSTCRQTHWVRQVSPQWTGPGSPRGSACISQGPQWIQLFLGQRREARNHAKECPSRDEESSLGVAHSTQALS